MQITPASSVFTISNSKPIWIGQFETGSTQSRIVSSPPEHSELLSRKRLSDCNAGKVPNSLGLITGIPTEGEKEEEKGSYFAGVLQQKKKSTLAQEMYKHYIHVGTCTSMGVYMYSGSVPT